MLIFLVPTLILLGNKGCEQGARFEHIAVSEGMECSACHDDGRTKETRPAWHDLAWGRDHGKWIRRYGFRAPEKCTLCHAESQCTKCHQQEAPRDHNPYWRLKGHALSVGMDRSRCFACHRGADFCQRCHSQTQPLGHNAAWGAPSNRHCLSCHYPLTSVGAEGCAVCHAGTPSHAVMPSQPSNALHTVGANCRGCHSPLRHPDNGMTCTTCHPR